MFIDQYCVGGPVVMFIDQSCVGGPVAMFGLLQCL